MTINDIKAASGEFISIDEACEYIGCGQQSIRVSAKNGKLPWAYQVGNRTYIPRRAFVKFHEDGARFEQVNNLFKGGD